MFEASRNSQVEAEILVPRSKEQMSFQYLQGIENFISVFLADWAEPCASQGSFDPQATDWITLPLHLVWNLWNSF